MVLFGFLSLLFQGGDGNFLKGVSGAKFCWQEITVFLKAASPNACELAGFNLWGGVGVCAHAHTLISYKH